MHVTKNVVLQTLETNPKIAKINGILIILQNGQSFRFA